MTSADDDRLQPGIRDGFNSQEYPGVEFRSESAKTGDRVVISLGFIRSLLQIFNRRFPDQQNLFRI